MRFYLLDSSIYFGFGFLCFLFARADALASLKYKSCSKCIQQKDMVWCEPTNHTLTSNNNENCISAATLASSFDCDKKYPWKTAAADEAGALGAAGHDYANVLGSSVGSNSRTRVGDQLVLNFNFTDAHKALDVYYLLDCTASMSSHRDQVMKQGEELKKVFEGLKMTGNYQIGLGTFVDKVTQPFGSPKSEYEDRTADYMYMNNIKLSSNVTKFIEGLGKVKSYSSLDPPEGTLEALMQVLVCDDAIGWRPNATKIVIVATDQSFHMAGMGRLAGILRPNDERCHTDGSTGEYDEWSKQDFPSINQIARQIANTGINVLFAVGSTKVDGEIEYSIRAYEQLRNSLNDKLSRNQGASNHVHVEKLEDNVGIVAVLEQTYKNIRSQLAFSHYKFQGFTEEQRAKTKVTYDYNCGGGQSWVFDNTTVKCENVAPESTVQFAVKILIDEELCKTAGNKSIFIRQAGELTYVKIDINPVCQCPCEKDKVEKDSSKCSAHGDFVCGVCECKEGFQGNDCSCNKTEAENGNCDEGSGEDSCSGKGTCKCGQCLCNEGFKGKVCEFNCSQCFEHGKCRDDGGCDCDLGFIGTFCQCRNDTTACKNPITDLTCGLSEVSRGTCQCSDLNVSSIKRNETVPMSCTCPDDYTGNFCEVCQSGACRGSSTSTSEVLGVCSDEGLKQSVSETHGRGGSGVSSRCQRVDGWKTLVKVEWGPEAPNMGYCSFTNEETECVLGYWYAFESSGCLLLRTHDTARNCRDVSIFYIAGGTVGGIVFAGLIALVIWKICMDIRDKREFEMFNKNLTDMKWATTQNLIYKPAVTNTVNPIFGNNRISRLFNRKSMMPNEVNDQ